MALHELSSGRRRRRRRVGRGIAAGQGKTAGRGTKGQKSRSGYNLPRQFEGGQTPLARRLPKRRGTLRRQDSGVTVDRALINKYYQDGEVVSPATLLEKRLIPSSKVRVKILGQTPLTVKVTYDDVAVSGQGGRPALGQSGAINSPRTPRAKEK